MKMGLSQGLEISNLPVELASNCLVHSISHGVSQCLASRTMDVDTRFHFVRERIAGKEIVIVFVRSQAIC